MKLSRIHTGIKLLEEGKLVRLYSFINERGDDISEKYITGLDDKEIEKLTRLFQFMLDTGFISNSEKFKEIDSDNKIFEFKSNRNRILCFILEGLSPKSIVLTHGFKKQSNKTPKKEIERAKQIQKLVVSLWNNDQLNFY